MAEEGDGDIGGEDYEEAEGDADSGYEGWAEVRVGCWCGFGVCGCG